MKKILVIPGPFVPYNDAISLLDYKRLAYLNAEMDVVAIGGQEDATIVDELKEDLNFKKFKITKILDYKKMDIVRNPFNIFYFLYACFKYMLVSVKIAQHNKYDFIYTSSHPGISHIIGYKIKKMFPNLVWFASFSDPIKNSPYKNSNQIKNRSMLYRIAFKIGTFFYVGDYYEEIAVKNADKLVFICEEQRDFTCSQYLNQNELVSKSIILPLTIEPKWKMYNSLFDGKQVHNNPLVASHLGRIYGLRKIDNFLIAISELKKENKISAKEIVFNQYDEIDNNSLELLSSLDIQDLFIVHDKLPYKEAMNIMRDSDILLLFDTLLSNEKIQPYLPSKISEYLVMRKQIIAVCDDNSPSYRLLKEYGHSCMGSDVTIIKENILKSINNTNTYSYELTCLYSETISKYLDKEMDDYN